ncbi:F-box/WD repeat-containing protein [Sporobolomyces koalae]|uniref:F-box/WD repeat-containing protein n=1 Tax=Sporobolomyces koalae TaxID=500713 RepID=UPI00316D55D3
MQHEGSPQASRRQRASSSHDAPSPPRRSSRTAASSSVPIASTSSIAVSSAISSGPAAAVTDPVSVLPASSPSRAFSRIWDRFSPPTITSPFSLPQQQPAFFRRPRSGSSSPSSPPASPARPEDFGRRRVPPKLEQHDSASQLSFSLRRASTGAALAEDRNAFRARSPSGTPISDGWEAFRLPGMSKWRSRPDATTDSPVEDSGGEEELGDGADDEACFVDEPYGKVDFLVSLPSEISLYILLHLDFRSLLACGVVSKQWRIFTHDPLLWRDLFHQNPKWAIKPEAYQAAILAAQRTATQTPTGLNSPSGYFGLSRPSMPNIKRAASSFGKARVKNVVNGADRVSQGSANLGKKLSGLVSDLGNISISSSSSSRSDRDGQDDTGGSAAVGDAGSVGTPTRPRSLPSRRTTATALMTLVTPGAPSTSTLPTHAFASPPSTSLSRTNSATALSSLASSIASLPPSRTPSTRRVSSAISAPLSPAISLSLNLELPTVLDWPKLYKDRWLLEQRWREGKPSWNWLEGHEDSVYCVQFDEKKVISGSRDKTIRIWDAASGTVSRVLTGHEGSILCLQYDDRILVSGSSDSRILVWDLVGDEGTGRGKYEVKMTLVGHAMGVLDLCFDEQWIVSCSKDTTTRIWNRHTGEFLRALSGHRGPVNAVALNSNRILTASGDALMKMWDIHTGKTLRTFSGHTRGLACLEWSPDGKEIVSGGNDQVIKMWNADTGECLKEFKGHTDLVRSLSFDHASRRIVSVGYDKTSRVWNVDAEGETREGDTTGIKKVSATHKFKSHASLVFDVDFDVSRIVSSSHDRRILLMDFGSGLDVSKFAS